MCTEYACIRRSSSNVRVDIYAKTGAASVKSKSIPVEVHVIEDFAQLLLARGARLHELLLVLGEVRVLDEAPREHDPVQRVLDLLPDVRQLLGLRLRHLLRSGLHKEVGKDF